MSYSDPSNSDDIIDSRSIIERIEAITSEINDAADELDPEDEPDEELADELKILTELNEEGENSSEEWHDGTALIRDDYFETYARDLADDIGAIKGDEGWPLDYIDWPRAAEALQMDYSTVDYDGVTYWVRQ